MTSYPIHAVLNKLKEYLDNHNRLILQAPPGAGKTTIVPLALLDLPWLKGKRIIMLEPRRLATRSAAARMAALLGEKVGQTVGYQIKQDIKASKKTRILVVTEGILTRKLQADPELEGVGLVIFDEFHERSLHADLSLAFCLQSQTILNESLKIMVMSATLNTQALSNKLNSDGFQAPTICSEGRSYPVDIIYRQAHLSAIDYSNLLAVLKQLTLKALAEHPGNILVFLPGVSEIKRLNRLLHDELTTSEQIKHIILAPLYGDLNKAQQDQAIAPPPADQRKIVLATNIAQTSLTIEGIHVVIDSGLQRQSHFDPDSGMNGLHTLKIARDTAEQRSGRAGRLGPGTAYRLWTEAQHKSLPGHEKPEILYSDLAPVLLELAQWGVTDMEELVWLDLPSQGQINQAKDLLLQLEAITETGTITPHGRNMLNLGLHPRLAHMILTARHYQAQHFNPVDTACLLAALLNEKDIIPYTQGMEANHDISYRFQLAQEFNTQQNHPQSAINTYLLKQVLKTCHDFKRRLNINVTQILQTELLDTISQTEFLGVLVGFAYPDRIAKKRGEYGERYLLANGKGACFNQPDTLSREPYLAIARLHAQTRGTQKEAQIFLATPITPSHIEQFFSTSITHHDKLHWNNEQQKVEALSTVHFGTLELNKTINSDIKPEQALPVLLNAIKDIGLDCLPWTASALNLKQRVEFINRHKAHTDYQHLLSNIDLPDLSDTFLIEHLQQWLQPHLSHETSIKHLQKLDLHNILYGLLSWEQITQLDQLLPEKVTVPSGSRIKIDYSNPDSPVLAVRLQELFGLQQTPTILNGCFPLLLHLLSPAFRPIQVTQDLASFWQNTYTEVKKELRGKYKKHYWPDNPLEAQATSRAKPRRK